MLPEAKHGVRGEADNLGLYMLAAPLSMISTFTPNISSGIWLSYLNELLSPYRLQSTDKVLIDYIFLPKAMGTLFGHFSNEELLYTLGWWFAQQYAVITSPDGGLASYGSAAVAQANQPIDCYAITESRFHRKLFYETTQASFGPTGLHQAAQFLAHLRKITIDMVRSLPWLDQDARNEVTLILRSTHLEPWRSEFGFKAAALLSAAPASAKTRSSKDFSHGPHYLSTRFASHSTNNIKSNR